MKSLRLLLCCAGALAFAIVSSAQVLMLDFGPTNASGANLTSSPYHSVTPGFTDGTWNRVQTADITTGLVWSDNNAAGVTAFTGGTSDATSRTISLASTPSGNSALGMSVNSGIYAGTSVATDGIFNGSSGNTRALGLQIGGLGAGTYDVYVSGRNTSTSATYTLNFYAGVSTDNVSFEFAESGSTTAKAGYQHKTLTYVNATTAASAWAESANYVKFSVTVAENEYINIASIGGGSNEFRGFFNAIQIVNTTPIPEPASAALVLGLASLASIALRRRHR